MNHPSTQTLGWNFRLLRAGLFKLDGGSMFGLIPRSVWSKVRPPDDKGRIAVQHNCLLLTRPTGFTGPGPRTVLIETGTGNKLDPKMRAVFDLENRWIADCLREHHLSCNQIDAVVVSHLHFDHAGALTRLPSPGEPLDWTCSAAGTEGASDGGGGSSQAGGCVRTFPNASIFVQLREWHDAIVNRSVMTRTYFRDHLVPIEKQLRLIDSPRPFPIGYTPMRDELPRGSVEQRFSELWENSDLFVFAVPGHTWGQQAVLFRDTTGSEIVFTPDILPTAAHVGAAYSLGYDVEPYTSMVSRRWFLTEAVERRWTLCLDHEPDHPFFTVRRAHKGDWFDLEPATPVFASEACPLQ